MLNVPEYEAWICPMHYVLVDVHEDDATVLTGTMEECGAELHIVWTFSWPVPTGDDIRSYNGKEVAANAYTTGWEVVCEEGHRLATHSRSAEDYAEDIDVAKVMGAIGAKLRAPEHAHSLRNGGHFCADCGMDME